jgi:environmental stress-induced protein Ves
MIIQTADCPPQPWKNGGGITRELFTHPSTDDWQIRISVADITKGGAFSSFQGVNRSFAVIEGEGVELKLGGAWQRIAKSSEPVMFDGAEAPECKLISGATKDLNVMCKHGHSAKLTRAYAGDKASGIGFFSLQEMTLYWQENVPTASAAKGFHIGWWINFL